MSDRILLFCQIHGDSSVTPFSVRVNAQETIDELKKLIKKEKPNDFRDIDADHLKLRKWNQPGNIDSVDLNSIPVLDPMEEISQVFPDNDSPKKRCIHIIIKTPEPRKTPEPPPQKTTQVLPEEWIPRMEVAQRIVARAHTHRMVLVRGTPGSGKTILLRLISKYLEVNHPEIEVKIIWMWTHVPGLTKSEEFIRHHTNKTYEELSSSSKTMILIDEAQITYQDPVLWDQFKILGKSSAMFILFSSYGSAGAHPAQMPGTPVGLTQLQRISLVWEPKIDDSIELPLSERPVGLFLQPQEVKDLIQRFSLPDNSHLALNKDACQYLTEMSGGHVGALGGLLAELTNNKELQRRCIGRDDQITMDDIQTFFFSEPTGNKLFEGLRQSKSFGRGLPQRAWLQSNADAAKFMRQMVENKHIAVAEHYEGSEICFKMGFVHKVYNGDEIERYVFPSPIHEWNCQEYFAKVAHRITHIDKEKIDNVLSFAIAGIKRMKRSSFSSPRIVATPVEDHYQKEFYSACREDGLFLSPEFGKTGVKGFGSIDFYLAPNKWGLEFTRDGGKITEHYNRFLKNGKYYRWIADGTLEDWVLLDFRTDMPTKPHPDFKRLYHIVLYDNFASIQIYNHILEPEGQCFPLLQ